MLSSKCGRFHVLGMLYGNWVCIDCGMGFELRSVGVPLGIVEVVTADD